MEYESTPTVTVCENWHNTFTCLQGAVVHATYYERTMT